MSWIVRGGDEVLAGKLAEIRPHLNELQWRLLLGAEARALGRGGIGRVARAAGVSPDTVGRGARELDSGAVPAGRVRAPGAGRPQAEALNPELVPALERLVDPDTRGDPESPLRWTTKSTANLADALTEAGHPVSPDTVGRLLKQAGYSLQGNAKTIEGRQHADRDAQFRYINDRVRQFQDTGDPVISVDTKKKELVGDYANGGREWQPKGQPEKANVHDFKGELGKAVPYGVYDVAANTGWVNVGLDADTGEFAVESIRRWWTNVGRPAYPDATRLLITADSGGSNGARLRLWKVELAKLAEQIGLDIVVAHLPPGTSKWNKHRLFSHISMNWRGRPLTSYEVIVDTIAATTTRTGLTVQADLDTGTYQTGTKITDKEMKYLEEHRLQRDDFHGRWNYTLLHTPRQTPTPAQPPPGNRARRGRTVPPDNKPTSTPSPPTD
jgi:Rhodopirellula transposase DDE domain